MLCCRSYSSPFPQGRFSSPSRLLTAPRPREGSPQAGPGPPLPPRRDILARRAHVRAVALPGQIALRADTPVFAVDYRKPPDFAFPAPGEDVLHAYGALRGGRRAEQVFLGGDTPGGTWPSQPRGGSRAWAAAPQMGWSCCRPGWTCLGGVQEGGLRNRDIDFICQPQAESLARIYSPSVDLTDVRVSPGLETRWRSWCPPTLLDYGGCESFHSQIELMIASMIKDGVDVDALEADGMVHCYPLMDFLWGSDPGPFEAYFARVARFLRR
ncbi:unnamed protein product [Prorocentrum cordatum]|uniref:Alpha/beta hydrolase fold-3 domain-containing protein n=1 Tax=Prorocentrum cordatum TaxID=2364126 RepID=A0ABN9T1E7_9DINO|nr:unnamed protein product [Polarella glacialis]